MLTFLSAGLYAQRTEKVTRTIVYRAELSQSVEQAKLLAVERAKIMAIDSVFGTNVRRDMVRISGMGGEQSTNDILQISNANVCGRWIRDIKEPEFGRIWYEQNLLNVTVTVKGVVREIKSAPIECKVRVLCDGTEADNERHDFKNGNNIYLSFAAPVDGYVVVYLVDAQMQAYCALPYTNQKDGAYHVEAGKEYVFFSKENAPVADLPYAEEYQVEAEKDSETWQLYVIFSPNEFTKPVDKVENPAYTRQLAWRDFKKWMNTCMNRDEKMVGENPIFIHITK